MKAYIATLVALLISLAKGQRGNTNQIPCGIIKPPYGGNQPGQYPWVIAVLDQRDWLIRYIGSGSLIAPNVALTAAHVVNETTEFDLLVRAGEWNVTTMKEQQHVDLDVSKIIIHEGFNRFNDENDIALLILRSEFKMRPNGPIGLICLPTQYSYANCFFNGWGKQDWDSEEYSSTLKKVDVTLRPNYECQRPGQQLTSSKMCGYVFQGKDSRGDDGAPLVCQSNGRMEQFGILVSEKRQTRDQSFTVYTNIPSFMSWINRILKLNSN
ncbi:serine protease 55 [Drosophila ficusphila]|uniref:serine protease 55 n=1 Tax=Drosophila ficusphila TaxID=30025 RepID=UPI001C8ABCCE|nr:serine protease 55 [Drosophila ficusphila]